MASSLVTEKASVRKNAFGQPIGARLDDWHGAVPVPRITVMSDSGKVSLEPLSLTKHGDDLWNACGMIPKHERHAHDIERLWTYLPIGPFETREAFEEAIQKLLKQDNQTFFAIAVDTKDFPRAYRSTNDDEVGLTGTTGRRALGFLSLMRQNFRAGSVELGWVMISPSLQRTTAATEAFFLAIKLALGMDLGYRRLEWKCDDLHVKSMGAARRLGFSYEGTFRQGTVYKGRTRNTAWFSLLDSEWPGLKKAFEAYLRDDNFNEDGTQIHRLASFMRRVSTSEC